MGHQGSVEKKVKAVENLDERVIKRLCDALDAQNVEYRMLVMPDHPTPIRIRTHSSDAIPYMLYDSTDKQANAWNYNEKEASASGNSQSEGYKLIDKLLQIGE